MTTIHYAGQRLETRTFTDKRDLERIDRAVFERVRYPVFKEYDARFAALCEGVSGTVVYGDVSFPHTDDTQGSTFGDIYETFVGSRGTWLIFTGSLTIERSMSVERGMPVAVLGNLRTPGLVNMQGELFVQGATTVPGALYFDSGNGGYTQLALAEPAGLVVTQSNAFDIHLRAHFFCDPLFGCGFHGAPTTPHEQRIQECFAGSRPPPKQVTLGDVADYFLSLGFRNSADRVRAGEYADPLWTLISKFDSRDLVRFLRERA